MARKSDNRIRIPFNEGGVFMEDEKDVFDRALEFLGTKWLEKRGIYDVKVRSVHIDKDKTPKEKPVQ